MEVRRIPMEQLAPLLEEQLRRGRATLPVTGSSMLPMLRGGRDVVELAALEGAPTRGDVLFYRRANGQYVLHRLIRMEDADTCLMCGDNQWQRELLPVGAVIARVERFNHGGKWINCKGHKAYQLYMNFWTALFPVRRPIIAVRRLLGRLRARIRREGK